MQANLSPLDEENILDNRVRSKKQATFCKDTAKDSIKNAVPNVITPLELERDENNIMNEKQAKVMKVEFKNIVDPSLRALKLRTILRSLANILFKHESKKDMLLVVAITSPDHGMYSSHIMFKELPSFLWRPGDLCVVYLCAVMNIMVLLLASEICVLFVDTLKARKCNASYPCCCSSLFHSSELEAKEDKVGMFNGSLVVRNEASMGYLFSAMQTKVVKGNVM